MTPMYELTETERDLLRDILAEEIKELQPVIHHTRSLEAKEALRERLATVERLLEKFEGAERACAT